MSQPDTAQSPAAVLRVDHLSIRLPAALSHHASNLGESVAEALRNLPAAAGGHVARLDVGRVSVAPNLGPVELSQAIAGAVADSLARRNR
jgi:hypothetical protein